MSFNQYYDRSGNKYGYRQYRLSRFAAILIDKHVFDHDVNSLGDPVAGNILAHSWFNILKIVSTITIENDLIIVYKVVGF